MLYREIIAVCFEIHTEHINTLCGLNVEFVNVKPGGAYCKHLPEAHYTTAPFLSPFSPTITCLYTSGISNSTSQPSVFSICNQMCTHRCRQHKIQAGRYGGCISIPLNTTSSLPFRNLHPPRPCYVTGPWECYVEAVTRYRSGQGASKVIFELHDGQIMDLVSRVSLWLHFKSFLNLSGVVLMSN